VYTTVKIQGYRGLRTAELDGFTSLNVFVGPNGCGKSAVLEAIYLAAAEEPKALADVCWLQRRVTEDPDIVSWAFLRLAPAHREDSDSALWGRAASK
jgi:predicted GTPase